MNNYSDDVLSINPIIPDADLWAFRHYTGPEKLEQRKENLSGKTF